MTHAADGDLPVCVRRLRSADAGEALTVQRAAFLEEVQRYGNANIPPLTENLDALRHEIVANVMLGAFVGRRLVGAARLTVQPVDAIGWVSRVAVAPDQRGRGVAARLCDALESVAPSAVAVFKLWVGATSASNIRLYQRLGYVTESHVRDAVGTAMVQMSKPRRPTLLLISGSLRTRSVNTAVLRTLQQLAGPESRTVLWPSMGALPHFDPDIPDDLLADTVIELRTAVGAADVLVLSTPEYAGALPGSFKNLLDWLVGGSEMTDRLVAWINPSIGPVRGANAYSSLANVLSYLGARPIEGACIDLPLPHTAVGDDGLINAIDARDAIRVCAAHMLAVVTSRRQP